MTNQAVEQSVAVTNQEVLIKIKNIGAYFQTFVSGIAKNPSEGSSVVTAYDATKATPYKEGSSDLQGVLAQLEANHLDYQLVPTSNN